MSLVFNGLRLVPVNHRHAGSADRMPAGFSDFFEKGEKKEKSEGERRTKKEQDFRNQRERHLTIKSSTKPNTNPTQ